MKNLKNILILTSLFISTIIFAQEYSFISKDLHLMSDTEMGEYNAQFSPEIPMYDEEGNKIVSDQIKSIMESGNFMPAIFADTKHKPKAIVFRKSTKEEKEQLQQMMAYQDPYADFNAGEEVPNVIAKDIDGNTINLHQLKGKIVVLNFWFTGCKPCIDEMPELNKLVKKYKNSNVEFVSITFETKAAVEKFLKQTNFDFKHIVNSEELLNVFKIKAFPTTIVVNKDGTMLIKQLGNVTTILDTILDGLTKN